MSNDQWRAALLVSRQVLGAGTWDPATSDSWCAFTTFSSLENTCTYWNVGLPGENELLDDKTMDGGLWRQSFYYCDLAHLVIPARFCAERFDPDFRIDEKPQDIEKLSRALSELDVPHRKTNLVLEIKLY